MRDTSHNYDVSEPEFAARVLEASKQVPVLVDFWASWCGPCKMLAPTLAKLADAYNGRFMLAKVNTDEEPRLAREYGVRALPTVKVFKDGRVVDEFMGVLPESAVRAVIERHVEHKSDKLRRQAEVSLEASDTATARRLLEEAAELDPDNPAVKIATAKMLMFTGAADRAQSILQSLPVDVSMNPEVKRLQAQIGFAQVASTAAFDESELERIVSTDPKDLQARYRLSGCAGTAFRDSATRPQLRRRCWTQGHVIRLRDPGRQRRVGEPLSGQDVEHAALKRHTEKERHIPVPL
jgi:putative thioredoxin